MVTVPLVYRTDWDDGFYARGWKIEGEMRRGAVIASTSTISGASPTSVPVHDILDHWVSGFSCHEWIGEAKAIVMHGLRNGIDVRRSLQAMAQEMAQGGYSLRGGEEPLSAGGSVDADCPARASLRGERKRRSAAVEESFTTRVNVLTMALHRRGLEGVGEAVQRWRWHGLEFGRMELIGRALQELLNAAECRLAKSKAHEAKGVVTITNQECCMTLIAGDEVDRLRRTVAW